MRTLSLTLALANGAAALLALRPRLAPPAAVANPPVAAANAASAAPAALPSLAPRAEFAAITERPLFSPSRRPDATAAVVGIASRYRLLGTVVANEKGRALVAPVSGGRAIELGEGDALDGWTVRRVEHDRVLFASPAGEATLAVSQTEPALK